MILSWKHRIISSLIWDKNCKVLHLYQDKNKHMFRLNYLYQMDTTIQSKKDLDNSLKVQKHLSKNLVLGHETSSKRLKILHDWTEEKSDPFKESGHHGIVTFSKSFHQHALLVCPLNTKLQWSGYFKHGQGYKCTTKYRLGNYCWFLALW